MGQNRENRESFCLQNFLLKVQLFNVELISNGKRLQNEYKHAKNSNE